MKKNYAWHKTEHDHSPYGAAFAKKVALFLQKGGAIANNHRDYCGMALFYTEEQFQYGSLYDGYNFMPDKKFDQLSDFVAWLAAQSDYSLSGIEDNIDDWSIDNQRITRERLETDMLKK